MAIAGVICAATKFTGGGSGYDFFMPNPACPDEEMLCHWAIETDWLKTIYSGNAETDDTAECIVQMPSWFVPLNDISTCTYSLTSLSGLGLDSNGACIFPKNVVDLMWR